MVDILFLAHGRTEFTAASIKALRESIGYHKGHTSPLPEVRRVHVMTDGGGSVPVNGSQMQWGMGDSTKYGGPVACLNHFIEGTTPKPPNGAGASPNTSPEATPEFVCKIDNDTIVPPGWLPACLDLMRRYPNVDLLGIEPWTPDEKLFPRWPFPMATAPFFQDHRSVRPVSHIGGIGVFRRSAFERFGRPVPNSQDGRYGFTEWQWQNPGMVKAFIDPPLPVFLLDHLPFEPWRSLSRKYEAEGIQRNVGWGYDAVKHRALWDWAFTSGGVLGAEGQGVGGTRL